MSSRLLCAPLAAFVGYAVAVSVVPPVPTAPGLTAKTQTPNVNVTATIVNTDGETLKPLSDPHGVFLKDTSIITASGSHPSFNSVTVKYSPADAAGLTNSTSFTVTHGPSSANNFTQSGYSIEPSNLFTYVDGGGTPDDSYAAVEGAAKVKPSGDLRATVSLRTYDKRAFHGCSVSEVQDILDAAAHAQTLATESYEYIKGISGLTPRYTKWFGRYNPTRKKIIEDVFRKVSEGNQFLRTTYDCECIYDDSDDDNDDMDETGAYVDLRYPGVVWVCELFWDYELRSRGGSLFHELTHFTANGELDDHFYGERACAGNATKNPWKAARNADNYMFFALNRLALL